LLAQPPAAARHFFFFHAACFYGWIGQNKKKQPKGTHTSAQVANGRGAWTVDSTLFGSATPQTQQCRSDIIGPSNEFGFKIRDEKPEKTAACLKRKHPGGKTENMKAPGIRTKWISAV